MATVDTANWPNPVAGVPHQLQSHVHLVSTYHYPTTAHLNIDTALELLLSAPKITRDVSAMAWRILEAQPDGTVLLVWQPQSQNAQVDQRFATDGYIWGDAERRHTQDYKGFRLEVFVHKIGYAPGEMLAAHSRCRYRLVRTASTPQIDSSLWLVHYTKAHTNDHVLPGRIPVDPSSQRMQQQRNLLLAQGQLLCKEFMLHDRANWPALTLPRNLLSQSRGEAPNRTAHMTMPQQYAGRVDPSEPSPAKRPRQSGPTQANESTTVSANMRDSALEDHDEDVLDSLTPRDISSMRFIKHHEWMEGIFSSPWDTLMIDPVPLGQGRKGALTDVTKDYLEAPTHTDLDPKIETVVRRLGAEKMAELTARVKSRLGAIEKEKQDLVEEHAKQMAEIRKGSIWRDAERALRAAQFSNDPKDEPYKLESGFRNVQVAKGDFANLTMDEIVQKVESESGKSIVSIEDSKLIQRGGLEEKVLPEPEPEEEDTEMADDLQDDSATFADFTTGIDEVPQAHTTTVPSAPQTYGASHSTSAGATAQPTTTASATADADKAGEDWVMVDRQQSQPPSALQSSTVQPPAPVLPSAPIASAPQTSAAQVAPAQADPGAGLVNFNEPTPDGGDFAGGEFDDQIDFDGIDTAGEALEGFGAEGGNGMDDSAFGDAFHHTES